MQTEFGMNTNFYIPKTTWGEVKQLDHYDIALLPWGATEPHNDHLHSALVMLQLLAHYPQKCSILPAMLPLPAALLAFKQPRPSPVEDFVCDWVTPAIPGKYASIFKKRGDRQAAPDVFMQGVATWCRTQFPPCGCNRKSLIHKFYSNRQYSKY